MAAEVSSYEQFRWYCEACGVGQHGFDHPDEAREDADLHNRDAETLKAERDQALEALREIRDQARKIKRHDMVGAKFHYIAQLAERALTSEGESTALAEVGEPEVRAYIAHLQQRRKWEAPTTPRPRTI